MIKQSHTLPVVLGFLVIIIPFFGSCAHRQNDRRDVEELFKRALQESRVRNKNDAQQLVDSRSEQDRFTWDKKKIVNWFVRSWTWVPNTFSDLPERHDSSHPQDGLSSVPAREEPSGPRVSSTFTQTEVRQAIQALANQAGVTVIIDQQVSGLVSAIINDQPFESALQRLLLPLGHVYRKSGDRYFVGVSDPSSSLYSRISIQKMYRAQEMAPKQLYELLPDRLQKFVLVSSKQQSLIIEAPRRITHDVIRRLEEIDEQVQQVVIEAIVAVFAPDSRFRFGFDFSQGIRVRGNDFANVMMQNLNLSGQYGPPQFSEVRNFSFTSAFLQALAEEGYLTIRAAPRVMARDGQEAKIRIGRQTFFSTIPDEEGARFFSQEIRDVESGIVLNMVPTVRGGEVLIDLKNAEVSEEIRTSRTASGRNSEFPVINRRKVSTTVEVEHRQTIVIGGLVQRTVIDQRADVPAVSRIPVMGELFKDVDRQTQQREIAIFLSPRIVDR